MVLCISRIKSRLLFIKSKLETGSPCQLIINVKADSFDALEQLQNTLQQKNVRVRQSNATTIDQQISANLELTL